MSAGHTPKEAAQLWCPMVREDGGVRPVCIGPGCAMWRWVPLPAITEHEKPTHGYCGLAGGVL